MSIACPYDGGCEDRNRYPNGMLFVGEIENGVRYPYGVYTKAESDAKYAAKETETDLSDLEEIVNTKADQSDVEDLASQISGMASETEIAAIRARLDALEYQSISIQMFEATPMLCEIGSSRTINLLWSLSKQPTSQNINGTTVSGSSHQFTDVTDSHNYTLNVTDGVTSDSKSLHVEFANQIYYGAAENLESVEQLSKVLSNEKERTFTAFATPGKYIIYAVPSRLGYCSFVVSGFEGGFEEPVEMLLTNESGYKEPYKVYRSTNASLGETTVEVKEA